MSGTHPAAIEVSRGQGTLRGIVPASSTLSRRLAGILPEKVEPAARIKPGLAGNVVQRFPASHNVVDAQGMKAHV
jgi:hypothetical protein